MKGFRQGRVGLLLGQSSRLKLRQVLNAQMKNDLDAAMSTPALPRLWVFAQALPPAWQALPPASFPQLLELLLLLQSPAIISLAPPMQENVSPSSVSPRCFAKFCGCFFTSLSLPGGYVSPASLSTNQGQEYGLVLSLNPST